MDFEPSELVSSFKTSSGKEVKYYSLKLLEKKGFRISRLPFSIRIVLESLLRNCDGKHVTKEDVAAVANWNARTPGDREVPFKVARILMQDFTGVPAIVDLAAMRDFVVKAGASPDKVQPQIPTDLVIDHSVQVDAFNVLDAVAVNQKMEMQRNGERYRLLKWAHEAFDGFRVFPPSAGICHQVNLEYLATCVATKRVGKETWAFPDTLVGTDSHTTMINGLGVFGFGVGGIEAEAAMLGEPVAFTMPKVLGVHLKGTLKEGVTATDFALTMTRILRDKGVVGMFVEFFGDGLLALSLPDRATLSNMCPEYGATVAMFPIDKETLRYLKGTGRGTEQIEIVKKYYEAQGMFGIGHEKVTYSEVLVVDLGSVEPCVSGPSQPKQEVPLAGIGKSFTDAYKPAKPGGAYAHHRISDKDYTRWTAESMAAENGAIKSAPKRQEVKTVTLDYGKYKETLSDGDVVIASITSCTNTSNPSVMIAAGLLARNAVKMGLKVNTRKVKTSLGPGSRVVIKYLEKAGLLAPLGELGFGLVGYGCITCIGNSGPLVEQQSDAINKHGLAVASVLSGNRNYEARIHPDIRANYLMSPPLVVAFAIAGSVLKDITAQPLGIGKGGRPVFLKDVWPMDSEIRIAVKKAVSEKLFAKEYGKSLYDVNPYWNTLPAPTGAMYKWEKGSTYINLPPFFIDVEKRQKLEQIKDAAVLAVFGDSISTDHISPAGAIGRSTPAAEYLEGKGVAPVDFNTYGARRGDHEVMVRGTFANNRIKNLLLNGVEGGYTLHFPDKKQMFIYEAAVKYRKEKRPLIVIAGAEYGSGSSRDWAAKGPMLLGVKAVIAKSFERIHRSNLIGMGILPLQFGKGDDGASLNIDYSRPITIDLSEKIKPGGKMLVKYYNSKTKNPASAIVGVRIDSELEMEYYKDGGVLRYMARQLVGK